MHENCQPENEIFVGSITFYFISKFPTWWRPDLLVFHNVAGKLAPGVMPYQQVFIDVHQVCQGFAAAQMGFKNKRRAKCPPFIFELY